VIELQCHRANGDGLDFYEHMRFVEIGEASGGSAIVLRKAC
jgi:hypothetical protein